MALGERNTIKMVADHWGCSDKHVRSMIASGKLAALRLGGVIRVTREQVEECEAASNTKTKIEHEKARTEQYRKGRWLELALETERRRKFGPKRGTKS